MVLRDCFECELDGIVGIKANLVNEAVQPSLVKNPLHLAECCFDGVEFGAVGDVVDRSDVELLVPGPHISRLVHSQLVHEQCNAAPGVLASQLLKKVNEV